MRFITHGRAYQAPNAPPTQLLTNHYKERTMKQIGNIFGMKVMTSEGLEKDEIRIISPTKEVSDKLQAVLGKLFQPGKYKFVEVNEDTHE